MVLFIMFRNQSPGDGKTEFVCWIFFISYSYSFQPPGSLKQDFRLAQVFIHFDAEHLIQIRAVIQYSRKICIYKFMYNSKTREKQREKSN